MTEQDFLKMLRADYKSLMSKEATAAELDISVTTLDRLRKKGEIKSKKVSGQIKFSVLEVARYLAA